MKIKPSSLFIFAGEQSGDLHGSFLIKALKKDLPEIFMWGVGGPAMRKEGVKTLLPMEDFQVMGLTDVIFSLPKLLKNFYYLRYKILTQNPAVVVLIDYPGFNLRLAKSLRKKGYQGKIVQYICPSIWAHSQKRIETMVDSLDLLLTIFPFEPSYFQHTSLQAFYVGNPLREYIEGYFYKKNWKQIIGLPKKSCLAGLFPGSREGEIKRNLPFLLEAAILLKHDYPDLCFGLSCANSQLLPFTTSLLKHFKLTLNKDIFLIPSSYTYELMREAHCAIAKSGTVTLELALHQCPTLVVYNLTRLNRFYGKYILGLKLPNYAIPNILAGELVFPELIESGFSSKNIYTALKSLLEPTSYRENCLEGCKKIQTLLEENKASLMAAKKILGLLSC